MRVWEGRRARGEEGRGTQDGECFLAVDYAHGNRHFGCFCENLQNAD